MPITGEGRSGEKPRRARLLEAEIIGEAFANRCEMELICVLQGGYDPDGCEREREGIQGDVNHAESMANAR